MKSVMTHTFSQVPRANIPRSSFDRSHGYKTAFDSGYLIPVFVDEALPGDTFNLNMTAFTRMSTPVHPIMDNIYIDSFFFAVPKRLIWDRWQSLCGERENPSDSIDYIVPTITAPSGGYTNGSLSDYFGIPTGVDIEHSAFWHRAYNLIYNEWFRDQNLQDSVPQNKGAGPDDPADYTLLRRGKRYDYFTSSLPWPQKGDPVDLPLGTRADIEIDPNRFVSANMLLASDHSISNVNSFVQTDAFGVVERTSDSVNLIYDPNNTLYADLTTATSATINQLREAFQIQKLLERDARGGTRYTEIIRSHFGVTSPDARLQRPEYLGGGSAPIQVTPIAQTSSTDATSPQGNLSAMATGAINGHGFTKSFTEHSVIIGLVNVRADLNYQKGLNRMFSRSTRYDFYWPSLAHLGEQAVLNKEIYAQGTADDDNVFGYQERFSEYRYKPSMVTGLMRSNDPQSLDTWHLSQDFQSLPVLNGSFIEDNPPISRVVAVPTEPEFIFDSYFKLRCARPMPLYGTPGMTDRY